MDKRPDTQRCAMAQQNFLDGYNCAQAVLMAFCDELGMDAPAAARLASSFGGGMAQLRQACGAVSSMFMVAGAAAGYNDPTDSEQKRAHYARIRQLATAFEEKNGSINCPELLKNAKANVEAVEDPRVRGFYQSRPCLKYVTDAAVLLEAFLKENA